MSAGRNKPPPSGVRCGVRRIDRLPPSLALAVALDLAGMVLFVVGESAGQAAAPLFIAVAAWSLGRGVAAAGASRLVVRWAHLTALTSLVAASLEGLSVLLQADPGVFLPHVAFLIAGAVHGGLWILAVPHVRPQSGAEPIAGVVYLAIAWCTLVFAPAIALITHESGPLAIAGPIATYAWALHWLAPRAPVEPAGRGLATLATGAAWGALGLAVAPVAVADGSRSALISLWLCAAIAVAGWLAVAAWRRGLRPVGAAAAALTAVLALALPAPGLPEAAIMGAATLGWIVTASRAGVHRIADPLGIAAGVALTVATGAGLSSIDLGPGLRIGTADGIALGAVPALARAAYLAALAVRAIRGADAAGRAPLPAAIARA
jgi:hypothetical protein